MTESEAGRPGANIRVAVDAMGGDYAPRVVVEGALQAARTQPVEILLVGDPEAVEAEIARAGGGSLSVKVVPSEGKIVEEEHPVQALRHKPKASVVVATQLLKKGQADALVSMGSTGGAMAAGALLLGTLGGLERPCIGGPFLGLAPKTVLVDMGSNVDCRPHLLLGFAAMGCAFSRTLLDIQNPRVGLLSVGSEEAKGNRQVHDAYQMFKESNLNFVGNVEGMDFFTDKADVIVCDGFVGNILLKYTEGLGAATAAYLKTALDGKVPSDALESLVSQVWEVSNLGKKMGGPLFGVNGTIVVGHGASDAEGVAGAIDTARRCVEMKLVESFREELSALRSEELLARQS